MSPQRKLLLLGTFVHSKTQQDLDFLHKAAIAVDAHGKIAAIERDAHDLSEVKARLLAKLGWDEAEVDVTEAAEGQFFFPGFVGEFERTPSSSLSLSLLLLGVYLYTDKKNHHRHTHPRFSVCQRRHLWQVKSPGMARDIHIPPRSQPQRPLQGAPRICKMHPPHALPRNHHGSLLRHH